MRSSTPLYAPDGMSAGGDLTRFARTDEAVSPVTDVFEAVHAHDRHDDGLVHNHHWAAGTEHRVRPAAYSGMRRADRADGRPVTRSRREVGFGYFDAGTRTGAGGPPETTGFTGSIETVHAHDRHDDGLVHNHGWAISGK